MKRFLLSGLCFFLITSSAQKLYPEERAYTEYEVKAAFLYNFTKFVEWPGSSLSKSSFTIGILGSDSIAAVIEQIIKDKTVQGKNIIIQKYSDLKGIDSCDILYVSESSDFNLDYVLSRVSSSGTLTIGDSNDFLQKGGMIHLYLLDNKLRFEINLKTATRSGIKISSKLLSLATHVES